MLCQSLRELVHTTIAGDPRRTRRWGGRWWCGSKGRLADGLHNHGEPASSWHPKALTRVVMMLIDKSPAKVYSYVGQLALRLGSNCQE